MPNPTSTLALCALAALALGCTARAEDTPVVPPAPPTAVTLPVPLDLAPSPTKQYHLRMFHTHTGESVDVTYRVGNRYVPSALDILNHFLRDHRTGDIANYDPHEFDVLYGIMRKLHRPNGVIDIVCGYRTEWSNEYLRETGGGGLGVRRYPEELSPSKSISCASCAQGRVSESHATASELGLPRARRSARPVHAPRRCRSATGPRHAETCPRSQGGVRARTDPGGRPRC